MKFFQSPIHLIILIFLLLVNISVVNSQVITPIAATPDPEVYPAIHNYKIVWQEYHTDWDIYMYDLLYQTTTPICTAPGDQFNPFIWENYIVWQDDRDSSNTGWDIYIYDILTQQEIPICTAPGSQENPEISDHRIVWQDNRNDNWDIYMYNLLTQAEIPVCTFAGEPPYDMEDDQIKPTISNDRIVWMDFRHGDWDLYMYNISTGDEFALCLDYGDQTYPSLWGMNLTWQDNREGNFDIFYGSVMDPASFSAINISEEYIDQYLSFPADQTLPRIYGNEIVFVDERSGNKDIYLFTYYQLEGDFAGHVIPVMIHPAWQERPVVWEGRVLWHDYRASNADIYMWERGAGSDMAMTIHEKPDPVEIENYLTYNLLIANYGPLPANNVIVKDTLSTGIEIASVAVSFGSWSLDGNILTVNIPSMNSRSYVGVTIVVRPLNLGIINNRAGVTANEIDEFPHNNHYWVQTRVINLTEEKLGKGSNPSMVVDTKGHVHFTYIRDGYQGSVWTGSGWYDYDLDNVTYISNESGAWVSQTIFNGYYIIQPIGALWHPRYEAVSSAIAIDDQDNIHLAYVVSNEVYDLYGSLYDWDLILYYRKRVNHVWQNPQEVMTLTIVDNYVWSYQTITQLSIEIDRNEYAHLFFKTSPAMSAGFLYHYTNSSGSWESEVVHQNVYSSYSAAIDRNNHIHISFYSFDINPGGPWAQGIGYLTNAPAGFWQTPESIEQNWTGGQMEGIETDIAVDSLNRPHVTYVSGQGNPQEDLRYAYKDSSGWHSSLIALGGYQSDGNKLALDSQGKAHVVYIDFFDWTVKYATNISGSWITETLEVEGLFDLKIDNKDNIHFYGEKDYIKYFFKRKATDNDRDGIPDMEEYGPAGDNPNYDGNGDGTPDSQQRNVTSFHTENGDQYITIESPDSTILAFARTISKPDPNNPHTPGDQYCPYGFFQFTLFGIEAGSWVDVNLYLHGGPAIETYYKYGSTPDSITDHWYEFNYLHPTGAVIHGDTVTLHLWDGLRGDDDLSANGIIVEPGGPTLFVPSGITNPHDVIPAEFALYQNYPNPFNPRTTIRYSLPRMSDVEITIYNILGQKVYSTTFKNQPVGTHQFIWDGRNSHGKTVASGMYIYQLKAGEFLKNRKMVLLR